MHPSNKYLLSIYYVPGTVLDVQVIAINKIDKSTCPHGTDILVREIENIP